MNSGADRCRPVARGRLFRRWLREEKFAQADFGADILPEPADPVEIVEDVSSDGKIPRDRNVKLEMAPQVVVFAYREVGLWQDDRQPRHGKRAVPGNLLATPRLLYAKGKPERRLWFVAQESFDIVRGGLGQRGVIQDARERRACGIYNVYRTVAVGME